MHVVYVLGPSSQDRKWKSIKQKSFFKQNNFAFFCQYSPGKNISYLVLNLDSQPETVVPGHIYFTFNAKKEVGWGENVYYTITSQLNYCSVFFSDFIIFCFLARIIDQDVFSKWAKKEQRGC